MLDRYFMSKMSQTGKIAYILGQILMILSWAGVVFFGMGMSFDDGRLVWILGAIGIVVGWGFACMLLFPANAIAA
jgi:hypothetical protein